MSQFSGAAAKFRQRESALLQQKKSQKDPPPAPPARSLSNSPVKRSSNHVVSSNSNNNNNNSINDVPFFVSPGMGSQRKQLDGGSQHRRRWTSSYLDKPSGTPRGSIQKTTVAPPVSPHQYYGGSYLDKASPGSPGSTRSSLSALRKNVAGPPMSPHQYGGSYLNKEGGSPGSRRSALNKSPGTRARMSISRLSFADPLESTPDDVKIKVTIPNIDQKMRARRAKKQQQQAIIEDDDEHVPEHIRRFREREQRAQAKRELQKQRKEQLVGACFYAWKARAQYQRIRRENQEILDRAAKETAIRQARIQAAIRIQKTFRMYIPRKRHVYVIACKRRREKNEKEIKRIEKKLAKISKDTKSDLKAMKKEHSDKKKELKRKMRELRDGPGKQSQKIKEQGENMISYLKEENKKYRQQQKSLEKDQLMLEKQFDLLTEKSAQINKNFQSLQNFVVQTNQSIQKNEIASQKCRHRYLPRYRKDLAERNLYCAVEYRVKTLYQKKIQQILKEIERESTDRAIYKEAKKAVKACEKEIASIPTVPFPPDLSDLLD
eukprot:scaffold22680_cov107-Cylindrotheca_fusiformis.AAC.37